MTDPAGNRAPGIDHRDQGTSRRPRSGIPRRRALGGCVRAVLLVGLSLAVRGAEEVQPGSAEAVARRCHEACVELLLDGRHVGSGWLASADGDVVTAAHLVERRQPAFEVLFADNRRVKAGLVALDRGHDLALLRADRAGGPFPFLSVARRAPRVGDELFQYGAPVFRPGLLQPGRVASTEARFEFAAAITDYAEVLPVAAMMQGGTSGGPWLNTRAEVVGVQSSVLSLEGHPAGVAFFGAAPALRRLLESRQDAVTATAGLGVDELWQQPADFLARLPRGTAGLVASVVRAGGPGAQAGIEARDVLVTAAGEPLIRIADLPRIVRRQGPGTPLEVKLLRPGETAYRNVRVLLTRAEELWPGEPAEHVQPDPASP